MTDQSQTAHQEQATDPVHTDPATTRHEPDANPESVTISWLEDQFPGWSFEVDVSEGWDGERHQLWIARREDHHPQAETSPAKLHTRLSDYLDRESQRLAFMN